MSSSRLPGKVLMDVEGQPMLYRQVDRLRQSLIDLPLVVATSEDASDDPIAKFCDENKVSCFRGSLDDVMLRFIKCGRNFGFDYLVRVGGDDPLIDPNCCNNLVALNSENPHDFMFASNRAGWPYGTAAELISLTALERAHALTDVAFHLEHIIPYFHENPDCFSIRKVFATEEICRPEYALTVDYPEDMQLIRRIFRELKLEGDYFSLARVIKLLDEKNELRLINQHLHDGFDR